MVCHQDVRRLNVPMDNPLLMRMLNGLAHLDEQLESLSGLQPVLVTETGNGNALN